MLITEEYRKLNERLHKDRQDYGIGGHKHAMLVRDLARKSSAVTILDYGCGKRTLERALGYAIANYDPALPGLDQTPEPADLVVCTDVLEHIEPECLDAVVHDLVRVTKQHLLLTVATRPAKKVLADGRNAHLIVEDSRWWLAKLLARFVLLNYSGDDAGFIAVMRAERNGHEHH